MQWLLDNPTYLWLAVVIVAIVVEAVTYALVSIWFVGEDWSRCSALPSASLCLPNCWYFSFFRSLFGHDPTSYQEKQQAHVRTNVDSFIGKRGIVTKESTSFTPGQGKVGGQIWTIVANDSRPLYMGEEFIVESVSGVKLVVEKIES